MKDDTDSFDDALMMRARGLAKEVQPERDLWPDIKAAIDAPSVLEVPLWQRYLAQAAAVVLLVAGSSGLTYLAVSDDDDAVTVAGPQVAMPLNAEVASFGDRYSLGPGFQDARRGLKDQLDQELARLSPEARAEIETNMQTIRTAIAEINAELADEPDNVLLQQLLLSSYREELKLMRTVSDISNAVMLREDF